MSDIILGQGKILQLINRQIGESNYEIARRSPGVRIICEKEGKILLTKEFRREQNSIDLRLPGGKVFDRLQDFLSFQGDILSVAQEAAIRETKEECGIEIQSLNFFHVSHCGATIEWDLYYFHTSDFIETGIRDIHPGEENITYDWYSYDDVYKMLHDNSISEDRTLAVLFRWLNK